MKIYEIGTGYTPIPAQVAAATESVVEELAKAFLAMGQDVEILDVSAASRAPHGLPITEVQVPSVITRPDVRLGILHKIKRVTYSVALAAKLRTILKETAGETVLHFHNQYNMFFFLKLVPKILRQKALIAYTNHNGFWSLPWEEAKDTIHKRYFQEVEAMKQADLVFVLNGKMRENVVKQLGIPEERVILICNGVNTEVYAPLSGEEVLRIKKELSLDGKRVILQVGSVNENKGQVRSLQLLAPALKQNKDLVFAYAGGIVSEEYHQEVKQLARSLGAASQVVYLGMAKPGREMNRLYNMADATIFASRYEGFPLVCIESLAAGVPVVLYTQMPLALGEGSIRLDTGLEELLRDADGCRVWKENARENAVKHFTWEKIAQDYRSAMRNAVKTGEKNGK